MADKLGVFICTGYGIGEALDLEALQKVATSEYKAAVCETIENCGSEQLAALGEKATAEELTHIVLAGPSARVFSAGDLPEGPFVEVFNLVDWVVATHEPNDEDTQMMAEDYLRMAITRVQKNKEVKLFEEHSDLCKTIMVVGGGVAGLTAAYEAAETGYEVVLIEKEAELGGYAAKLHKSFPKKPPYTDLEDTGIGAKIDAVKSHDRITIHTSTKIASIVGGPGLFDVTLEGEGNEPFRVGAIVQATGFKPAEPTGFLGYGENPDVVTNAAFEEMACKGSFVRPSDGKAVKSVAFVQFGDSRNRDGFTYTSAVTSLNALKQAKYIRQADAESKAYVMFEHLITPGQYEEFYRNAQDDAGIFLTRGYVSGVDQSNGRMSVEVKDTMIGEDIQVDVDLVVINAGMVPNSADGEAIREYQDSLAVVEEGEGNAKYAECKEKIETLAEHKDTEILNLDYRQGPDLPTLTYGYPDSHFICFPYETRRTGIYTAGAVRSPMDGGAAAQDALGATLKAIQSVEMLSRGETVHPRAGDLAYPEFTLMRCTQCKRCTEECPFGAINEDAKGTPEYNVTRCRRCGICHGACPERIIGFPDYYVDMVASMIKNVEVPDEFDEKPRVLVLACENDAVPALEAAALHGIKYSSFVRVVPVRCLGSVNVMFVKEAISNGYDGVLMFGCKYGDDYQCHYIRGSELMNTRGGNIKEALEQMSMENERVALHQVEISDYELIPRVIDEFMELIEDIGMNPFKGM